MIQLQVELSDEGRVTVSSGQELAIADAIFALELARMELLGIYYKNIGPESPPTSVVQQAESADE